MERLLLWALAIVGMGATPFILKKPYLKTWLIVFLAKGILAFIFDVFVNRMGWVKYPVRPFPKFFDINILFDLLAFPLLSVIWVKQTYHANVITILGKSLYHSIPFSLLQWYFAKNTKLFQWKNWNLFYTFASVSFTLLTIRGFIALLKKWDPEPPPETELPRE
ncbi:hypothetical protein D7Z54_31370 [Salibacterium salarium]|uniref:Uncharacterized protein n=1 Tax=Salibacterium salarium TaxID=284579 RepID=A0A428MTE9_9BACI|nr:CBO0543 family protein [Salibacterium salarium]RSL29398.1 hypothetical protein D7Z54_31370 [Salibacterium salarium]